MAQYVHVHSRETIGDIFRRRHPQLAEWDDPKCLALFDEAVKNAPPYLGKSAGERAEWIWYYVESKVERK